MARLALNKSTLNKENRRLKAYRQFVPALDLKRKQLMVARADATAQIDDLSRQLAQIEADVTAKLKPLLKSDLNPLEMIKISRLEITTYNLVGIRLPRLEAMDIVITDYPYLVTPVWLDALLAWLEQSVRLKAELGVAQKRLQLLQQGLQKTTQRLNLFEKVLIPRTQSHIRRIGIALSDAERAGVVRAKIAKNKRSRLVMA